MRVEALSTDFYRRLLPPTTHSPWPASPRTSPASCSRRRPPPGPCRRPGAGASRRARGHLQGPPMAARGRGLGTTGEGGGGGGDAAAAGAGGERVASRYRFKLSPVSRWICTIACRRSATEVGEAGEDAAGWTSVSRHVEPSWKNPGFRPGTEDLTEIRGANSTALFGVWAPCSPTSSSCAPTSRRSRRGHLAAECGYSGTLQVP